MILFKAGDKNDDNVQSGRNFNDCNNFNDRKYQFDNSYDHDDNYDDDKGRNVVAGNISGNIVAVNSAVVDIVVAGVAMFVMVIIFIVFIVVALMCCSSPRWDNLPSGHQHYPLKGLNLGCMYWGQKDTSE